MEFKIGDTVRYGATTGRVEQVQILVEVIHDGRPIIVKYTPEFLTLEARPEPKPKLLAWLFRFNHPDTHYSLTFYPEGHNPLGSQECIRATWLDEPEEK